VKERQVIIGHRLGIHARAAARLVQLSTKFQSDIVLTRPDSNPPLQADGRSILSILLLAAGYGSSVIVRADGADEDRAIESICEYLTG
jgi:phosphotransferase system HPr (HPr) family protein